MRKIAPYFVLFLLALAFLWKPVFMGQALLPGQFLAAMSPWETIMNAQVPQWNALQWDALAEFYPWRLFYSRSIEHGVFPFWNPHQFSGTSFVGNGQSAIFYPFNLLFVLFGPITGLTANALLHLFLAGTFTFLLARRLGIGRHSSLISGIIYAFSGFMIVWLELPTFISVAAWLPLILLLLHISIKGNSLAAAAWAGAAAGVCVLGGHLQIAFYCWLAAFMWGVGLLCHERSDRRRIKSAVVKVVTAGVIAIFIASAQLLPSVELARQSHRSRTASADGYQQFIGNSIPAMNIITMFVPDVYGDPSENSYLLGNSALYTETALYTGVLSLLLAVMGSLYALRRRGTPVFFAAMALTGLLLAFGTPLNALLYYLVPGVSALGGPHRIIVLYTLAVALLAGFGADWLGGACANENAPACDRESGFPVWAVAAAVIVTAVTFVIGWLAAGAHLWKLAQVTLAEVVAANAGYAVLVFAVLFAVSLFVLFVRSSGRMNRRSFLQVCLSIIVLDLLIFGVNYNPTVSRVNVYPETPGIRALKNIAGRDKIAVINPEWSLYRVPEAVLPPNSAMVYGLYDAGGYDSLFTKEYKDRVDNLMGMDSSPVENGNMILFKEYNPELKSLAKVFVSREPIDDLSLSEEYADEFYIYRAGAETADAPTSSEWMNPNRQYPFADKYEPHSVRIGLYLMLMAVMLVSSLTVYEYFNGRSEC